MRRAVIRSLPASISVRSDRPPNPMKRVSSASFRRALRAGGAVLAAGALAAALSAQPITIVQSVAGTYNWSTSDGTLWSSGSPNGAGVLVERNVTGSSISINQDVAGGVTIGGLSLLGSSANSLTILMNNAVSNPSVTFNNNGNGAVIAINSTSAGARIQFSNSTSGTLTLADDLTLRNVSYGSTGNGTSAGAINLLVPISGNGNLTVHNAINALDKGAVVLSATSTFVGNVTIASGITQFTRSNSFGASANPVTLGIAEGGDASLIFNATTGANVYNNITVAAGSGGTLQLGGIINGNATTAPSVPVFHGKLTLNSDVTLVSKNISATTVQPQITTVKGVISGSGNIKVTGSSASAASISVQMLGANTFDGITRIESGVLRVGASAGTESLALQNSTVDLNAADAGQLQFGYTTTSANVTTPQSITSATFGGLTGSRGLTLQNIDAAPAAVALKVGHSGLDTQYDGVLAGPGSLEKVGAGQLKLTAAQEYTGATTVSEGILLLDASSSLHAQSAVTVGANGTLTGSGRIAGNLALEAGGRIAATLPADPVAHAPLRVDGSVTFAEGAALALAGDEVAVGLTWTLVRAGSFAGSLPQLALPAGWHGSLAVVGDELRFTRQNQVASATAAWRELHFGSATIDASSAANADPEGDGWTNLVEFALGLDPLEPDGSAAVALATETDRLTLTFARHADPALTYAVEAANTPAGPWTVIWSSTGEQNIAGPVTVTDPVSLSAGPARFLRVSISTAAW